MTTSKVVQFRDRTDRSQLCTSPLSIATADATRSPASGQAAPRPLPLARARSAHSPERTPHRPRRSPPEDRRMTRFAGNTLCSRPLQCRTIHRPIFWIGRGPLFANRLVKRVKQISSCPSHRLEIGYMCYPNSPAPRAKLQNTVRGWWEGSMAVPPRLGRIQEEWSRLADVFYLLAA